MVFKPEDEQETGLNTLLEEQQDPLSPNYQKWLSPEEFADRFGLSPNDVSEIVSWLHSHGFTVDEVARTRRWVSFTGTAEQVESAFQTRIHEYSVEGENFYANSIDPAVPPAFANVILGFRSLNNFRMKPRPNLRRVDAAARPQFTSSVTGYHYLTPADFATIYDLGPLYAAGFDGAGQKIAVMGQTDIQLSDIRAFRSASGLPANDSQVVFVPGSGNPGIVGGDVSEASLDIEWAGAIARNAQIVFVVSRNGVFDSLQYTIDQNLAPVVSISYGSCEQNFTSNQIALLAALGQQANAQGITIVAASGDTGAADCEAPRSTIATRGLAVDIPASLPSVTGLGGTEFRETNNSSWAEANDPSYGSALSYIPEIAWNDTAAAGVLSAGGGGRSIYFSKPAWQAAPGVPNDNTRDVPDISLSASGGHDGYLMCSLGRCVNGFRSSSGALTVVGGTSAGAPAFAGIVAIINQVSRSSQGNINPKLYSLTTSAPAVFHDITSGGNQVPCRTGTADCPSGGSIGYSAGAGYDQSSGIGSVDAANLVAAWVPGTVPASTGNPIPAPAPVPGSTSPASNLLATPPLPISAVEQGTVHSGYAVITPDPNSAAPQTTVTFGSVSGGAVQSQAGIVPMPLMTDALMFLDVIPVIGGNLGIAIANPSPTTNYVTLTLRDETGTVAGTAVTVALLPEEQLAKFISELLPSAVGVAFRGTLKLQSSTPFAVLGLRFAGSECSTLSVTGTVISTGVPARSLANGSVGGAAAIFIPQFAMSGAWATQFALINNSGTTAKGRIDIFDQSGNPRPVTLNGVTQSTFSYTIPPGGVFTLAPRDANGQSPF